MSNFKRIFMMTAIAVTILSTFQLMMADEKSPLKVSPDHITEVAIAGLANAESEAATMIRAGSESYICKRNPVYGQNNSFDKSDTIIAYLTADKLQKRISRWVQNKDIGKLEEIWYSVDKNSGQVYTEKFRSGFDGKNSYSYYSPPNDHTGNGQINAGGRCSNGFLIGDPWGGNFSSAAGFSSDLSAANAHFVKNETINGLETLKIVASENYQGSEVRYTAWICPQRSFRCIRKEMQIDINGAQFKERHTVYETLDFEKYNNDNGETWLPKKGVSLDYLVDNSEKRYWRTLDWYNLLEAKPLEHLKDDVFAFEFPLGTTITDSTKSPSQVAQNSKAVSPLAVAQELKDLTIDTDIKKFIQQVVDKRIE